MKQYCQWFGAALIVALAVPASAQTGNGAPSGPHYNLNIIGVDKPKTATLTTSDRHTIFVLWQGRVPTVISPGQLHVGDSISVRIRAPHAFSLAQVEQVPANHVGDHEPAASS